MSKEQWGHGYYTGLQASSDSPEKYLTTYNEDGYLSSAYRIVWRRGTLAVLEWIDWLDMEVCIATNTEPSDDLDAVIAENCVQANLTDMREYKLHLVFSTVVRDYLRLCNALRGGL